MKNYKVIFFGSPEFALPALSRLISKKEFSPVAVVTQPDKPKSRGKTKSATPVKDLTLKHKLPVLEPENLDQKFKTDFAKYKPDLAVVAAYGKIIPRAILAIPVKGFVNIHPSLLPKYRGSSPIQAAILNNDQQTGVTIMLMDLGLDSGDILAQKQIDILPEDNAGTMHDKLAKQGAELLIETLPDYLAGKITPQPQDNKQASLTKKINKNDGRINWQKTADQIRRQIRAMTPWPSAWTIFDNQLIKIAAANVKPFAGSRAPGTAIEVNKNLAVVCGQGMIVVNKIKRQGKDWLNGKEFLQGFKQILNQQLN